jgi:hypothetical protein
LTKPAVKHKGSIFEIVYRRLVPRLGHNKTTGAIAHRICQLVLCTGHRPPETLFGIGHEAQG